MTTLNNEDPADPSVHESPRCPVCDGHWHSEDCVLGEEVARRIKAEDEAAKLRRLFGTATLPQFLTDVSTAAGLLEHGKRDKALANRIADRAYELRTKILGPNYEYHPSKTHRYFIADPGNGDTFFFATEAERDAFAADLIKDCLDVDGWYESVEDIYVGEVTHLTARTNVTHRPSKEPDESVADYHERLEAEGWPDPDCDYTCSYELRPLNVNEETK